MHIELTSVVPSLKNKQKQKTSERKGFYYSWARSSTDHRCMRAYCRAGGGPGKQAEGKNGRRAVGPSTAAKSKTGFLS